MNRCKLPLPELRAAILRGDTRTLSNDALNELRSLFPLKGYEEDVCACTRVHACVHVLVCLCVCLCVLVLGVVVCVCVCCCMGRCKLLLLLFCY